MRTITLDTALALSDRELLARVESLASTEREATAELVAHLAALELRPSLYVAEGHGSLFGYCTRALKLSEDAACARIRAARTCRRFPMVLDLLASGAVSLTTIRLIQPHLTAENHEAVLARASHRRREAVEALVAELAPRPDVPASVRKLPSTTMAGMTGRDYPVVRASSPGRYRVQFTIGQETHDKLRRLQALMRRDVPSGDIAVIFDQAVDRMLEEVERAKLGAKAKPRHRWAGLDARAHENRIRFRTDEPARDSDADETTFAHREPDPAPRPKQSRHIPNAVKRAVWRRDGGRCAFIPASGGRCVERAFLEFHHIQLYALGGPATARNISLRCRRHNAYEAERDGYLPKPPARPP